MTSWFHWFWVGTTGWSWYMDVNPKIGVGTVKPPNHPILIGLSTIFTMHFGGKITLFLETPILGGWLVLVYDLDLFFNVIVYGLYHGKSPWSQPPLKGEYLLVHFFQPPWPVASPQVAGRLVDSIGENMRSNEKLGGGAYFSNGWFNHQLEIVFV